MAEVLLHGALHTYACVRMHIHIHTHRHMHTLGWEAGNLTFVEMLFVETGPLCLILVISKEMTVGRKLTLVMANTES